MKKKYPISRKDNLVVQEADNEILIYDLNDNKAYCLNKTSALVWELCDGTRSLTDISQELSKRLKAKADEGLVWLALEQLKKEKLIENEVIAPAGYQGISRREAVRKVGLASLIAIPVVMSLQAPVAAATVSACGPTRFNGACHCADASCPGNNTQAAPITGCPGAALTPEGQPGLIVCNAVSNGCSCVGPFTCVNSGPTSMHKQGHCG